MLVSACLAMQQPVAMLAASLHQPPPPCKGYCMGQSAKRAAGKGAEGVVPRSLVYVVALVPAFLFEVVFWHEGWKGDQEAKEGYVHRNEDVKAREVYPSGVENRGKRCLRSG